MTAQPATILALMAGPLVNQNGRPLDRLDRERETRQLCQRLREIDRAVEIWDGLVQTGSSHPLVERAKENIRAALQWKRVFTEVPVVDRR